MPEPHKTAGIKFLLSTDQPDFLFHLPDRRFYRRLGYERHALRRHDDPFVLQTLSGLHDPEKYFADKKQLCAYAVVFLLVCLLRRNGIFVALPTTAALLLFSDIPVKTKKITALLTGTAVCCFFLLNQVVFLSLGYAPGPKKKPYPFRSNKRRVT